MYFQNHKLWGGGCMKMKIISLLTYLTIFPMVVYAGDEESYFIASNVLNALLGAISWSAYAIAFRNAYLDRL